MATSSSSVDGSAAGSGEELIVYLDDEVSLAEVEVDSSKQTKTSKRKRKSQ